MNFFLKGNTVKGQKVNTYQIQDMQLGRYLTADYAGRVNNRLVSFQAYSVWHLSSVDSDGYITIVNRANNWYLQGNPAEKSVSTVSVTEVEDGQKWKIIGKKIDNHLTVRFH